jgi:hypothetical protein
MEEVAMRFIKLERATIICIAATLVSAGCATAPNPGTERLRAPTIRQSSTAWVVEGRQMLSGSSVLDGLRSRFPSMHVRTNGQCPDIFIRGHNSIQSSNAPRVYVDGQRAADSCILNMMRASDVARVEIYPTGHTNRPGYLADPNGLILVFTRSAPTGA